MNSFSELKTGHALSILVIVQTLQSLLKRIEARSLNGGNGLVLKPGLHLAGKRPLDISDRTSHGRFLVAKGVCKRIILVSHLRW